MRVLESFGFRGSEFGYFVGRESMPAPQARPHGLWLAVLLSLAFHALFALALWALPVGGARVLDDRPLADVPVVVVPVDEFTVSLAAETSPHPAKSVPAHAETEAALTPIGVGQLPLDSTSLTTMDDQTPRVAAFVERIGNPSRQANRGGAAGSPANRMQNSGGGSPTFFGVGVPAQSVVFVIDRSISMGLNGGLDAAKREVRASLERLGATTRFQVLFYNREIEVVSSAERDGLLENTEASQRDIIRLVDRTRAKGGTDHLSALRRAISLRPEAIFVIRDAEDLLRDQVRDLTYLNGGRSVIHALQWSRGQGDNEQLKALAHLNRGTYRKLPAR
jgi:hypothetical protein